MACRREWKGGVSTEWWWKKEKGGRDGKEMRVSYRRGKG